MDLEVDYDNDGKIIDFITGNLLVATPEEKVRQKFLKILHYDYKYNKNLLKTEVPIFHGSKELRDSTGKPIRADIVVYNSKVACANGDQGKISFIVECKAQNVTSGYNQLVSYIYNTSAKGGVWFNDSSEGENIFYFRRQDDELVDWTGIPRAGESWDSINRRKKSELLPPKDVKALLRRCHNKLHGRGHEGEEEDLTMDMVRIILAKAQDEENEGNVPEFYCTPEEFNSTKGTAEVADRIQKLFSKVKELNPDVFSSYEQITVGNKAICSVVVELQQYRLLADIHSDSDWDIMGNAYEQYTATYLKKQKGQFFTNRIITDFLVKAINPQYTDIILDPAGGSGGFLTSSLRFVRKKTMESDDPQTSKDRRLDIFRTRLFMIDMSPRLVKIAKTAMILNGDGHTGMVQGDSLGEFSNFDSKIISQCTKGVPNVILTNPPFAGTGDGRITDKETLLRFDTGKKWIKEAEDYFPTDELNDAGVPPELLFFERCVDWLAPGGTLGIILPKSFLDTHTYLPGRKILFENCWLKAVINLHKNTFQPHTGVRTCLIILKKKTVEEKAEDFLPYTVFMGISKKVGQDSEGVPIYKKDATNHILDELDEDMTDLLKSYNDFKDGMLIESEFAFSVLSQELINNEYNINPQKYLPSLNETLRKVQQIDNAKDWNVIRLSDIDGVSIFKGPRLRSENLIVENSINDQTEKYYTPSAILQEKSDSAKWLDLSLATKKQLNVINEIRVKEGDIVISRSGSIGRVTYITKHFDNVILSDDMIRVRIPEKNIRLYVYFFLQSNYAIDQMLRNEYGAVQQHLEPTHVRDILIPIPDNYKYIQEAINSANESIKLKEKLLEEINNATNVLVETIDTIIQKYDTETQ